MSPLCCPLCSVALSAGSLEAHLREELGYPSLRCLLCPLAFTAQRTAEGHFRGPLAAHPDQPVALLRLNADPLKEGRLLELVRLARGGSDAVQQRLCVCGQCRLLCREDLRGAPAVQQEHAYSQRPAEGGSESAQPESTALRPSSGKQQRRKQLEPRRSRAADDDAQRRFDARLLERAVGRSEEPLTSSPEPDPDAAFTEEDAASMEEEEEVEEPEEEVEEPEAAPEAQKDSLVKQVLQELSRIRPAPVAEEPRPAATSEPAHETAEGGEWEEEGEKGPQTQPELGREDSETEAVGPADVKPDLADLKRELKPSLTVDGKVACVQCGLRVRKNEFKRHVLTSHWEGRPFVCVLCPHKEKLRSDLAKHQRAQHQTALAKDTFTFASSESKVREAIEQCFGAAAESDWARVKCRPCDKLVNRMHLKYHVTTEHLKKPLNACRLCPFTNCEPNAGNMNTHVRRKHGQAPGPGTVDSSEALKYAPVIKSMLAELFQK